jgi:hypothetical protein
MEGGSNTRRIKAGGGYMGMFREYEKSERAEAINSPEYPVSVEKT